MMREREVQNGNRVCTIDSLEDLDQRRILTSLTCTVLPESCLNLPGRYNDVEEDATMRMNYPAVVVCAIVYWLLGGLWFDWLFSKQWMALEHMSEAQASSANPVWIWPFILTFLLNLLIAFVLAQVCIWRNANTAARGAAIGILLWLGIVGPIVYTTYMYEMRPMQLFAINEFYPLVGLCLMGGILGAWTKKAA